METHRRSVRPEDLMDCSSHSRRPNEEGSLPPTQRKEHGEMNGLNGISFSACVMLIEKGCTFTKVKSACSKRQTLRQSADQTSYIISQLQENIFS